MCWDHHCLRQVVALTLCPLSKTECALTPAFHDHTLESVAVVRQTGENHRPHLTLLHSTGAFPLDFAIDESDTPMRACTLDDSGETTKARRFIHLRQALPYSS